MSIIVGKSDATEFVNALRRVVTYAVKDARRDAAAIVLPDMVAGAQAGYAPSGEPYVPYKPKYALFRQKHGLQTGHVDLTFDDEMLRNLAYREREFAIRTSSDREGALRGHQYGNPGKGLAKREVLGASAETIQKVEAVLSRKVMEAVHGNAA